MKNLLNPALASTSRVASDLYQCLPILIQALCNQTKVKVQIGGDQAWTDNQVVQIPALPVDSPHLAFVALGYAIHEVGHVLYTCFESTKRAQKTGPFGPLVKRLTNAFEDGRIEAQLIRDYPGASRWLESLSRYLRDQGAYRLPGDASDLVINYAIIASLHFCCGYDCLKAVVTEHEQAIRKRLPVGAATRLLALVGEVADTRSTSDCIALARRVEAMLEDERDKEQQQDASADAESSPHRPTADAEQSAGSEGQGTEASAAPKAPTGDQAVNASPNGRSESAAQVPAQTGDDDGGSDVLQDILQGVSDDAADRLDGVRQELANNASRRESGDRHDDDHILSACVIGPARSNPSLTAEVDAATVALRTRLHGLMQADTLVGGVSRHRSGTRIDRRSLWRSELADPRIFARKSEDKAVDTAVHILLDNSSSMAKCMALAQQATLGAAMALDAIADVSVACSAFPGRAGTLACLTHRGEDVRSTAGRYTIGATGSTPLAQSMWYPLHDLLSADQARKMLIVITDGEPNCDASAKRMIDRSIRAGIEVVAIGINEMAVKDLFPDHEVIKTLPELPYAAVRLFRRALHRHWKRAA